jgi:diketogulonate reductase-like aldo/keto reductase
MGMNIPTKKLKNGFELPVYGLGLWQMGGRLEANWSDDEKEITAIKAALDAGVTHIDAAESYGNGHAEELLGKALVGRDRTKLIIASKVSAWNQGYDQLKASCKASLARIGTDYLDLYLLHRFPEPGIDIKDTMRAMNELVDEGLVRNIGVCNLSVNRFKVAQKHSTHPLVCNQVHYNVQYREIETKGVLKHAQNEDVMLVAWRPLQKGTLPYSALIDELGKKYGKTRSQVVINWIISQTNVVTLSKTSSIAHLKENLGALNWIMDTEDIERIRDEYPDQQALSDAVPLNYEADIAE